MTQHNSGFAVRWALMALLLLTSFIIGGALARIANGDAPFAPLSLFAAEPCCMMSASIMPLLV